LITLAVDTSEARGSVALLRGGTRGGEGVERVAVELHIAPVDYSEWLLPAVERVLAEASAQMEELDLLAVATGPGSFTGVRVGLTTVKAWAEVYGKPVVGVSRLEAMARSLPLLPAEGGSVAACYDAQRSQLFAALYRHLSGRLAVVESEQVLPAQAFVNWVDQQAGADPVSWVSLDAELITTLPGWQKRSARGDAIRQCAPQLAVSIGRLAEEHAKAGRFTDPLELDANYVRRSDAEIFWKGR
jgi:tRNA threonylcarbamoyladenosine biosynthesis protein TsaB